MGADQSLWMVRLVFGAAELASLEIAERLPPRHDDRGYLLHGALANLFGKGTVQPFRLMEEPAKRGGRRDVTVLGYTPVAKEELRDRARRFADPAIYQASRWPEFTAKPMPDRWEAGRRLGFELRACPVVRLAADVTVDGGDGEPITYHAGREVDAWVHRRWLNPHEPEPVDRSAAYATWLRDRLERAAKVGSVALSGFRRVRLVRRGHGSPRKARVLERPDALLRGELTVESEPAFHELLRRGVGRHRAFGFGMLLLRPPG